MDIYEIIYISLIVILVILLIFSVSTVFIMINHKGEYKCVTIDGEEIKCVSIYPNRGYITGKTSDGTTYMIKSYKELEEGE